jgi:hypothetical protein
MIPPERNGSSNGGLQGQIRGREAAMDGISGGGRGKEWGEVGKFLAFWRVCGTHRTTTVQVCERERDRAGREMHESIWSILAVR